MAGTDDDSEKTHEPTLRRLEEAIKRGDVPRSVEVNTWFVLGGLALMLMVASGGIAKGVVETMSGFLAHAETIPTNGTGLLLATRAATAAAFGALSMPLLIGVLAALAGAMLQHRPLWTTAPLAPKFSRLSPLEGLKRIAGKEALTQFIKGLMKIIIVGGLGAAILWGERDRLEPLIRLDLVDLLLTTRELALKMLGGILALLAVVAAADYLYQRLSWLKRNRMTTREMKEEYKESEGNPEIKAKVRQLRAARVRKRMMQAVPQATVIVMNPTHFAVALKYESGMAAPVCVAKGVDSLALRIRAVGSEHAVPIIENPPLARALHAAVEIDEEIPVEHFKAVAEIIGYVMRLRRRQR